MAPTQQTDDYRVNDSGGLLERVRAIHIRSKHLANEALAGSYHSAFRGKGIEFQEVRHYVPGDDIRDIDWNVTARTGEPYVKIYHEERELTVILMVDLSSSNHFASRGELKEDVAVELTAMLAFSAIKNGDKVGLILFCDQVVRYIPPQKGRAQVWRIIRDVLAQRRQGGTTDIAEALTYLNRVMRRRSVVFLISDFLDTHDYSAQLRIAAAHHDLICCSLDDPLERQLPEQGVFAFENPETGEQMVIDCGDYHLRREYEKTYAAWREAMTQLFRSAGAATVPLSTTTDYLPELLRLFRSRERRSR